MSKTRDTGFLNNVVKTDSQGNVTIVSGSTTLLSISSSGAVTTTGVISGSNALTASYAQNSELLDNLDSTAFVFTSSYNPASSSFSTRVTKIEGNYATTGSNVFLGAQTVCANITSTGTIIAQTLNVQQVTSSVVYSSGSNVFGCLLTDVQQMTGSLRVTGSGVHYIQGGCVGIGTVTPAHTLQVNGPIALGNLAEDYTCNVAYAYPIIYAGNKSGLGNGDLVIQPRTTATRGIYFATRTGGAVSGTNPDIRMAITYDGLVGIGTITPGALLDVNKCAASNINVISTNLYQNQGNLIQFCQNTTGGNVIGYIGHGGDSTGDFTIFNGATKRLAISCQGVATFTCQVCTAGLQANGPVVLGGTGNSQDNPTRLAGTSVYNGVACYGSYGKLLFNANTNLTGGALRYLLTNALDGNKFGFIRSSDANTDPSLGTSGAVSSGTATMVFDAANVGIATTTPCARLHVALPAYTSEDTDSQQVIFGSGTAGYGVRIGYNESGNAGYINSLKPGVAWSNLSIQANNIIFSPSAVQKVIITNSGITCFACQVCAPRYAINGTVAGGSFAVQTFLLSAHIESCTADILTLSGLNSYTVAVAHIDWTENYALAGNNLSIGYTVTGTRRGTNNTVWVTCTCTMLNYGDVPTPPTFTWNNGVLQATAPGSHGLNALFKVTVWSATATPNI